MTKAGKFIEWLIDDLGFKYLSQFAKAVGRDQKTIRNWKGEDELSNEAAERIGERLHIPKELLLAAANLGEPLPDQYRGRNSLTRRSAEDLLGRALTVAMIPPKAPDAPKMIYNASLADAINLSLLDSRELAKLGRLVVLELFRRHPKYLDAKRQLTKAAEFLQSMNEGLREQKRA